MLAPGEYLVSPVPTAPEPPPPDARNAVAASATTAVLKTATPPDVTEPETFLTILLRALGAISP